MWYNSKTSELQSTPPWGASYLAPAVIADLYSDWSQVADDFVPTITVTAEAKIAALDAANQSQFDEIALAYAKALLSDAQNGTSTAASILTDYEALVAEYKIALAAIE